MTKLSLYQGCQDANDRQSIERCQGNEYSTSARIKATTEWTSLVSHGGIEGRVTKGRIINADLTFMFYNMTYDSSGIPFGLQLFKRMPLKVQIVCLIRHIK